MSNAEKLRDYYRSIKNARDLLFEGRTVQAYEILDSLPEPMGLTIKSVDQIEGYWFEMTDKLRHIKEEQS